MNHPSLACVQRVHRLGQPRLSHAGCDPSSGFDQFAAPPVPVPFGVENDPAGTLLLVPDDAIDKILERIECLSVPANEQPSSIARDAQANLSRVLPLDRIDPRSEPHEPEQTLK